MPLLLLVLVSDAMAFRCGTREVVLGDTQGDVLYKCGEPSWVGGPWEQIHRRGHKHGDRFSSFEISVIVEEWMYNLGPTRFVRFLRFENGILVAIRNGSYGY